MFPIYAIFLLLGAVLSIVLGWWSVQSLLQARLLSRWRRVSHAALADTRAAVWGEVRVRRILDAPGFGECLWHREVVTVKRGKSSSTESDRSEMADFSVVADGHEFHVVDPPTEVDGKESETHVEDLDLTNLFFGRRTYTNTWLRVVPRLAVVGWVKRRDGRWEVGKDAAVGLLLSAHHPAQTALHEALKGGFGLAGALAGLGLVIWFATR